MWSDVGLEPAFPNRLCKRLQLPTVQEHSPTRLPRQRLRCPRRSAGWGPLDRASSDGHEPQPKVVSPPNGSRAAALPGKCLVVKDRHATAQRGQHASRRGGGEFGADVAGETKGAVTCPLWRSCCTITRRVLPRVSAAARPELAAASLLVAQKAHRVPQALVSNACGRSA